MKELLVIGLLMWLSANSPLPWDGKNPPEVIQAPAAVLAEIYYNGKVPPSIAEGREEFAVAATYNWKTKQIYILDTIDLTTLTGKSILLHELVHYLQYRHGLEKNVACVRKLEILAYKMQMKYYFDQGGGQLIIDPIRLFLATQCASL